MARSPRAVFGRVSDARWHKILKRSITQPVIDGVRLPGFAAAAMQSDTVGSAGEHALGEAFKFYTYVKAVCAKYGRPVRVGSHILDFGVSWGRMIRFFLKDVDAETLHGVDVSQQFLRAAQDSGVPGDLRLIDPLGALPHPDASLDLVYAYSVFTHLPERVQDHWLAEIQRTLKPGGIFIATVEPPRFLSFFLSVDASDPKLNAWQACMARKVQADLSMSARLQSSGFIYIPDGDGDGADELYGDCVMTPAYVNEHWGRYFEVLEWLDDRKRFWQAVVVARKR